MKHDETGKQRPEVAVPVTAVGTEAASRAVAGVRGHAVLLLSKLTFMLNALKKKFFFKVKKSKKSAGSPCSDLRGWLILSTPASILGSLRGPPRASRDQTLLPSSAHTPLSLPQPHQACGGGGGWWQEQGTTVQGRAGQLEGLGATLGCRAPPPQLTTPTLSPMLTTPASPTASLLPTPATSFQEGGGCPSLGMQEPQAGSYFLLVLGPRPPLLPGHLGPDIALGRGAQGDSGRGGGALSWSLPSGSDMQDLFAPKRDGLAARKHKGAMTSAGASGKAARMRR